MPEGVEMDLFWEVGLSYVSFKPRRYRTVCERTASFRGENELGVLREVLEDCCRKLIQWNDSTLARLQLEVVSIRQFDNPAS
jgi:hypothetical protein